MTIAVTPTEKILLLDTNEGHAKSSSNFCSPRAITPSASAQRGRPGNARQSDAALLLIDRNLPGAPCREMLAEWKSAAATQDVRVSLLVSGEATDRALALDLGADDAVSRPFDPQEMLARVRGAIAAKRASDELRQKVAIAVEGQQHRAHGIRSAGRHRENDQGCFVAESRAENRSDSRDLGVAAVMAVIFFVYSRSTQKEQKRATAIIARWKPASNRSKALVAEARKLRGNSAADRPAAQPPVSATRCSKKPINSKRKSLPPTRATQRLQKQLAETNARLKKVEAEGSSAENIIGANVSSVCLLHIAVGFTEKDIRQAAALCRAESAGRADSR